MSVSSVLMQNEGNSNPFFRVDKTLLHSIGINRTLVYACIREQFILNEKLALNDGGWLQISIKKIQKDTDFSDKTVREYIKDLINDGLIACFNINGSNSYYKIFTYRKNGRERITPIKNTWIRIFADEKNKNLVETSEPCTINHGKFYRAFEDNRGKFYRAPNPGTAYGENTDEANLDTTKNTYTTYKEERESYRATFLEEDFNKNSSKVDKKTKYAAKTKNNSISSAPKTKYSNDEHIFVERIVDIIHKNHPKIVTVDKVPKLIESGLKAVHVLTKRCNDFPFVCKCIEWAVHDKFWKYVIQSLAPLPIIKKQEDLCKFDKIAAQYLRTQESLVNTFDEAISKAINGVLNKEEYYKNCDRDKVHDLCSKFFDDLDKLSTQIRNPFHWHKNEKKFATVLEWCLTHVQPNIYKQLDIYDWTGFMLYYFDYLLKQLDVGRIDTIHAGMFCNESALFTMFIDWQSDSWQREIFATKSHGYGLPTPENVWEDYSQWKPGTGVKRKVKTDNGYEEMTYEEHRIKLKEIWDKKLADLEMTEEEYHEHERKERLANQDKWEWGGVGY